MVAAMKLTFIWQEPAFSERDWIGEIFAPIAGEQVFDGAHRIVLDNCLLIDSYLHARPPEYYSEFRGRNAWLLHLSDETYEGGCGAYSNFRGIFRNYHSSVFKPQHVLQLPLGYGDGFAPETNLFQKVKDRELLWSFVGEAHKSSRPEMQRAFTPLAPHLVRNTEPGVDQPLSRADYQQTLLDSIFIPCPMGNVSLESFRIYEALECGAIPLLEKRAFFDYFTRLFGSHPLPTFTSWPQAARFVASIRADSIALNKLQQACLSWWHSYKPTLSTQIESFFAATAVDAPESSLNWQYRMPGWQTVELLRHQTLSTLSRRVRLQSARLMHERRLRKTFGK
jgi:hypothetical protein